MKLSDTVDFMNKTHSNMYSTIVPATVVKKRRYFDQNRSTSFKKSVIEKSDQLESPHLAATFTN